MDLLENPFYILTAKSSDNRQQIMELADERSLSVDPSDCMRARSELTNPKKRISAEIAWLLGITPQHIEEALSLLHRSPVDLLKVDGLTSIARANLLVAGLSRLPDYNAQVVSRWILNISQAFEDISPRKIASLINKERIISGFPEITDDSLLQEALKERRQHYRQIIRFALEKLSQEEHTKAITQTIATATDNGKLHSPVLIADLADLFEVEAQTLLDQGEEKIDTLVKRLRGALSAARPESELNLMVKELIQATKNWDILAQPIQVSTKSLGLGHNASYRVAMLVRNLAIDMVNKHEKIIFAQQLTQMLLEVFAEVEEVAELAAKDAKVLDKIIYVDPFPETKPHPIESFMYLMRGVLMILSGSVWLGMGLFFLFSPLFTKSEIADLNWLTIVGWLAMSVAGITIGIRLILAGIDRFRERN